MTTLLLALRKLAIFPSTLLRQEPWQLHGRSMTIMTFLDLLRKTLIARAPSKPLELRLCLPSVLSSLDCRLLVHHLQSV